VTAIDDVTTTQHDAAVDAPAPELRFRGLQLWWLSPVVVSLFIGTAAIILTALVSDQQFRAFWDEPKIVTSETMMLFECGVLAFALGSLIANALWPKKTTLAVPWPCVPALSRSKLQRASVVLTTLTVVGYAGFVMLIIKAGLTPAELIGGSDHPWDAPIKTELGNIPGVTILTQIGIAAVAVSSVVLADKYSRAELFRLIIVVGLSIPRAYVYSERLAFLELVVPVVVVGTARLSMRVGFRRTIAKVFPVAGIALGVVTFSFFEYFRSWQFYRLHGESSFPEFVLNRLAGYYATAINNGQVILDHLNWPGRLPFDTLEAFWSMQGVYQLHLYEILGGHDRPYAKSGGPGSLYFDALDRFTNPEFNNPSGYVAPFVDYGPFGGLVFFLLFGVVAGLLYREFCNGRLLGLLVYPVFFTGLVEWPRYMYWVQSRAAYSLASLLLVAIVVGIVQRRAERRGIV
jgi:oligosaccharide repeat unit polymerase